MKIDALVLMRIVLTTTFLLFLNGLLIGQFNFIAGYRACFVLGDNILDQMYAEHGRGELEPIENDLTAPFYEYKDSDFGGLGFMNGVDVGVNYRLDNIIFEASWKNKRKDSKGVAFYGVNEYDNRITTSLNAVSLGIQQAIGMVSLGATIDYNWLKISSEFERGMQPDEETGRGLTSHFSVSFNFGSTGVIGFTLQPFIQYQWNEYDFGGLQDDLNVSGHVDSTKGKINTIGIALIIRNGQQSPW